jgi:ABC-2 type transport system permease protein
VTYVVLAFVAVFVALRLGRRRRGRGDGSEQHAVGSGQGWTVRGDIPLVAAREIRERTRGRIFRVGTIIILLAVAAAVVIPTLHSNNNTVSQETVAVVGVLSAPMRSSVIALGPQLGTTVTLVDEPDLSAAELDLNSGRVDLALVDSSAIVVKTALQTGDSSTTAALADGLALTISLQRSLQAAGLSPTQAGQLTHPIPLPITGLHAAHPHTAHTSRTASVYGLILLFVLLSQYGTWILMGVVEEKSSRVVEVLLATLKPVQLLAGKVLGIGVVALAQAALIVAVALGLGAAVGSDVLHGSGPSQVLTALAWLILGYTFYCWVYAAAGSLATRQEHIQTLAFPLQLPIILGYITSLTALSSGSASTFVHVLAYLPPTAPFAMPVLIALGVASWWQITISVALTLIATILVARLAANVYERAILRTGQRVRLRELRSGAH